MHQHEGICSTCGLRIDANGSLEENKCFLHKTYPPMKPGFGGKELPFVGPGWNHRREVKTLPDAFSIAFQAQALPLLIFHDQGPRHPLCNFCETIMRS